MTASHIATLALETWRSLPARERTYARLASLVGRYAETYVGTDSTPETIALVSRASTLARIRLSPWEEEQ